VENAIDTAGAQVAQVAQVAQMTHLYAPIPPLRSVSRQLEHVPLQHFASLPAPERIALVTWTDRVHTQHARRNAAYCKRWGYTCFWNTTRQLPHLPKTFEKLPLVRWALEKHDVVLQIDDDASVHRQHQPLEDFLRTFPTSSLIASNAGWEVPLGKGEFKTTWDVSTTVNPAHPAGVHPAVYYLQGGLLLWRRSNYTTMLLDALLANDAQLCRRFKMRCCYEQDAIIASTRTSWMLHVGLLPMHAFNCFPGDKNTYGECVDPFVLHIAGMKAKDNVNGSLLNMHSRAKVG